MKIIMFDSGLTQPEDECILLKDIIEKDVPSEFYYGEKSIQYMNRGNDKWMQEGAKRADRYTQSEDKEKSFTLTANMHKGVPYNFFKCKQITEFGVYRKLTPRECMRLQTIPEHHIDTLLSAGISNTQLYKMTGNAWNMKTISHILKELTK